MTDEQKRLDIASKKMFYDAAKRMAKEASDRASRAEALAAVEREFARKMADRQNEALRALNEARQ